MANPLQSTLLKNNNQLNLALKNSPPLRLGARGDGVKQVQKALKQLGFSMPISFPAQLGGEPDGAYGQETHNAVFELQRTRLFPQDSKQWDGSAGAQTLPAMDDLLLKGGPAPPPSPTPPAPIPSGVTIVPLATTPLTLIATFDNPGKGDLNASDPPVPPLTTIEFAAVTAIRVKDPFEFMRENDMAGELFLMAGSLGSQMFNLFKKNRVAGAAIKFPPEPNLAPAVEATPAFLNFHNTIRVEFENLLKKQFAAGRVDVNLLEAKTAGTTSGGRKTLTNAAGIRTAPDIGTSTGGLDLQLALKAVIGGKFQGGIVALKAFAGNAASATYTATLQYTFMDHFGVDNSDVVFDGFHGTPGQVAFWILQHEDHPGHNPFVTTVIIEKSVSGNLK